MRELYFKLTLTGETAEYYADVCDELVFEDFISRHLEDSYSKEISVELLENRKEI